MQTLRLGILGVTLASGGFFVSCSQDAEPVTVPPEITRFEPVERRAEPVSPPLAVGETVDVFVLEDESFNGRYIVRAEGDIILPKVGRVDIGGKSITAAEASVKGALEVAQLKEASVIIDRPGGPPKREESGIEDEKPSVEVFVSGKVAQPGRYRITSVGDSPPSVYQSILQTGGFTRWAYPKKVHILRRSSNGRLSRIDTNIDAISSGEQPDVALQTGDIVVVPEKKVGV